MTTHGGESSKPRSVCQPFENQHVKSLQAGTVLWLPRKDSMPEGVYIDPDIQDGAFNHPCVVLSLPGKLNIESIVEIAYMTSKCKTLPSKNRNWRIRTSYLRIVTAAKPFAKDCLHFKNGMMMARDYSNVFLKAFKISVKALQLYERDLVHVLTKQSLTKLLNAIKTNSLREDSITTRSNGRSNSSNPKSNKKELKALASKTSSTTKSSHSERYTRKAESLYTESHDGPNPTTSRRALPRGSSKTPSVIVISDTESENDGFVASQSKLPKKLSTPGISLRPRDAIGMKRKLKAYNDDDDGDEPIEMSGKRKRDGIGIGEDEDDWDGERKVVKKRPRH